MAIKKVGVLGCGLMGSGIAQVSATAGFDVVVLEADQKFIDKGFAGIEKSLTKFAEKPEKTGITPEKAKEIRGRLKGTLSKNDLADCDIVIEAIIENPETKKKMFGELDAVVKKDAIFAASSVMQIDEVFEAKIASWFTIPSNSAYIAFFSAGFSTIASTMMSQSARSSFFSVPFRRARIAEASSLSLPFSANLASDFSIPEKPLSMNLCSASSTTTSNPAVAQVCAIPLPIKPQPSTPTLLISIRTSIKPISR
jgi:hypothetical protein